MAKGLLFLVFMTIFATSAQKKYAKSYYPTGTIQAEGWMSHNDKVDYWYFYYDNGNKKQEGHFEDNKKCKWWLFYDSNEVITRKTEYQNDLQNGISILYKDGNIVKAEKYKMGVKTNEWTSLSAYRNDKNK
ncbi:toxin-antitoxin system YwqK family antitoxin [Flavobacterium algicola]|uniref:toxin-antitoxin system YwqK family antitoxin n=1 Tax=Flavobacterium algicola TaxID=556529 RepID=UPI001EFC5C14|nr:hypothetical protein [Flavobacterium algicola]MCG9792241.1 hypothetical protein [Flavobacterium algicola]